MTTSIATGPQTPFADPTRKATTDVDTLMITARSETAMRAERDLHAALTAAEAATQQQWQRVVDAEKRHREDIALIGETLIQEADDRGWCRDYDKIVDRLNAHLTVELARRERDYTVTATVELRLTVTAASEDEAREQAATLVDDAEQRLDAMPSITAYPQDSDHYGVEEDD